MSEGHLRIGELSRRSASAQSSCARGSSATGCYSRPVRPAVFGSTRSRTKSESGACAPIRIRAFPLLRQPGSRSKGLATGAPSERGGAGLELPCRSARALRRARGTSGFRLGARDPEPRRAPARSSHPLPARPRRTLGGRYCERRAGAFCDQRSTRTSAWPGPRLGTRRGSACRSGLRTGRAARLAADRFRSCTARTRLARHVSRAGYACRHAARHGGGARAEAGSGQRHHPATSLPGSERARQAREDGATSGGRSRSDNRACQIGWRHLALSGPSEGSRPGGVPTGRGARPPVRTERRTRNLAI